MHEPTPVIGIGVVSALGQNCAETRINLYADTPGLPRQTTKIQTELSMPVFELDKPVPKDDVPGGFAVQLLLQALDEALEQANIPRDELKNACVGVAIGTTVACQLNNIPFYDTLRKGERPPQKPFIDYIDGNPAEYIRRRLQLNGPAITVSNACSSGADAIGIARLWLMTNQCDYVIAGGTDELNKVPLDGFNALGVCSKEPCRPFDASRTGLNLGEAAGVLILAKPTTQKPHQFAVAGFGKAADAFHITQPAPDGRGLEKAIRMALQDAGNIQPQHLDFINAHGTGTQANDQAETHVFAKLMPNVPFMSTKPLTGHTLGAAGAIEAIFTLICLEQKRVPKSARFETLGEDVALKPLTQTLQLDSPAYALSTSLAFGGSNTALVLNVRPS